jgi:hypothetical protein
LNAKEDERLADAAIAATKKETAKNKKAREIDELVTKGLSLLPRIQ